MKSTSVLDFKPVAALFMMLLFISPIHTFAFKAPNEDSTSLFVESASCGAFTENFDDGVADNWTDDGSGTWAVASGVYRMTGTGATTVRQTHYNSDVNVFNFVYEARVRKTAGYATSSMGLILLSDGDENSNAYTFQITTNGFYTYDKHVGGVYDWLANGWIAHTAINTGSNVWNTLKVVVSFNQFYLYCNGTLLTSFTDSSLGNGKLGLRAYDFGSSIYADIVEFDNVWMSCDPALGDELAVDFGTSGLWYYNGTGWNKISTGNAQWMTTYGGKLAADFGAYGTYEYDGASWTKISTGNPDNSGNTMVAYNGGLVVDFGASGLYFYNGTSWNRISSANAQWLEASDGKLVADFGSLGVWEYHLAAWKKISTGNADNSGNTMAVYTTKASGWAIDFGASGLWYYLGTIWYKISPSNVQWLTVYGDKLVADFGTYGLYEYDGADWTKITTGNPDNSGNTMVAYNGGLAVDFGASGLYFYNGTSWNRISSANAQWLEAYDGKLVADFGSLGLWEYNGSSWVKLSTGNADNGGNTMTDW